MDIQYPKTPIVVISTPIIYTAFIAGCKQSPVGEMKFPEGTVQHVVHAEEAIHTVWADTLSIIQITGIGPWEAKFLENSRK